MMPNEALITETEDVADETYANNCNLAQKL